MAATVAYNNSVDSRTAGYIPVFGQQKSATPNTATTANSAGSPSFKDFLKGVFDTLNPLQHIPIVGAIYRHLTGDEPAPMARIAGDALYGGVIGAAVGMADVALQQSTGKDIGETAIAMFTGDNSKDASPTMLAANTPKKSPHITWDTPPQPGVALAFNTTNLKSSLLSAPVQSTGMALKGPATVLATQAAPAEESRMAIPPGLIASKMMDALDKYQAMKQAGLAPQSPTVTATF